jgi:tripartite-type tricarboxylate transporter receptor subunit TctC
MQRRTLLAGLCLAPALSTVRANAPVRLIVPFPAGGATDVVGRIVAEQLARELGTPVIVENRAGAGGSLGMGELAKAAPDGATFGIATISTHAVNPVAYKNLPYRTDKDFTYISEIARAPSALVVNPNVPAKTLDEFIKHAKKHPGKLSYGSPGIGSGGHIVGEIFKSTTGTFILHVPYRGSSGVITDLIGGQIDMAIDQVASALPHLQAGRLRALAVSWGSRLPMLPDVPTFGELGYFANNDPSWFGVVGPAGLKAEVVRRMNAALKSALSQATVKSRMEKLGVYATWSQPEEFAARVAKDLDRMSRTAKFAKLTLE